MNTEQQIAKRKMEREMEGLREKLGRMEREYERQQSAQSQRLLQTPPPRSPTTSTLHHLAQISSN